MSTGLFWIGFCFIVLGLGLTLRAIYIVTANRGLDAAWLRGLRRTQQLARQVRQRVLGGADVIDVSPTGIASGEAFGNFAITLTAEGRIGPVSLETQIEALEQGLQQVREAISAQAHDLSSRIDSLRSDAEARAAEIDERITIAEQQADKIDAVAFNSEMLGVACIALGTLIQAVSTLA